MILAGSTLAQAYLAEGYQTSVTGLVVTLPWPPASSSAWAEERTTTSATWTEDTEPGTP